MLKYLTKAKQKEKKKRKGNDPKKITSLILNM